MQTIITPQLTCVREIEYNLAESALGAFERKTSLELCCINAKYDFSPQIYHICHVRGAVRVLAQNLGLRIQGRSNHHFCIA